ARSSIIARSLPRLGGLAPDPYQTRRSIKARFSSLFFLAISLSDSGKLAKLSTTHHALHPHPPRALPRRPRVRPKLRQPRHLQVHARLPRACVPPCRWTLPGPEELPVLPPLGLRRLRRCRRRREHRGRFGGARTVLLISILASSFKTCRRRPEV
ncbi:hypothetical protein B0H15DRAFT_143496, partial [Mycena belliarum]